MALTDAQVYSLVGVVLILVGVMWYNRMASRRPRPSGAGGGAGAGGAAGSGLLLKFVHHEGSVVGESVALDGDRLVLKQGDVFKSVPAAQARDEGREVRLTGDVDWAQAVRDGQAWRARNTVGQDPDVAGRLTRSEDVRAPALDALRRRSPDAPGPVVGAAGSVGAVAGGVGAGTAAAGARGAFDGSDEGEDSGEEE